MPETPLDPNSLKLELTPPLWLKVLINQGPPTAMLIILVSVLVGWVDSPMLDTLRANGRKIDMMLVEIREMRELDLYYSEYQNVIWRTLCRNVVPKQDYQDCDPKFSLRRGYRDNKWEQK